MGRYPEVARHLFKVNKKYLARNHDVIYLVRDVLGPLYRDGHYIYIDKT